MDISTRSLQAGDKDGVFSLYRVVAADRRGFARAEEEVSAEYVEKMLRRALGGGIGLGAVDKASGRLIGFITARKPGPKVFDHVMSDLTIGVHPEFQSKGVGRRLFIDFFDQVLNRPDVLRVELLVRESNLRAISFYESLGFRREGVFEKRIRNANGEFESDVPMGWLKPDP